MGTFEHSHGDNRRELPNAKRQLSWALKYSSWRTELEAAYSVLESRREPQLSEGSTSTLSFLRHVEAPGHAHFKARLAREGLLCRLVLASA